MAHNFADLFEHSVDLMAERVALIDDHRVSTYRDLEHRANQLAHHLTHAGITAGSHVGFQMHNSIETMETLLACYKLRAVPVNINYRYTADELRYLYRNADLRALIYHDDYAEAVTGAEPPPVTLAVGRDGVYERALAAQSTERDFGPRSADDLFIMYTGGTTGLPKGVVWRQEDMWRTLGGGIDFYTGVPVPDEHHQSRTGAGGEPARWFALPPLIHAAAMMPTFTALWSGNSVVLAAKFNPNTAWDSVARHRPQVLVITGDAMGRPLVDAYRARPVDATCLLAVASGAALLSQTVKNELLDLFGGHAVVSESIGASETGFGGIGFAQRDTNPGRGPQVKVGRGATVVDDNGHPVGVGEEGWLAKTGAVPLGYYNDPARSAKLFKTVAGHRVVITEDRARVDADGVVTLLGRGNMVVNTGGEKVFVEEVEGVVTAHRAVRDALVIGVPDERWGHQVAAVIAAGTDLDFVDLDAHVRQHLAGYKVPRRIWIVDAISRTPSGKPDYRWAKAHVEQHPPDHLS